MLNLSTNRKSFIILSLLLTTTVVILLKKDFTNSLGSPLTIELMLILLAYVTTLTYLIVGLVKSNPMPHNNDNSRLTANTMLILNEVVKSDKRRSFDNCFFEILRLQESIFNSFNLNFECGSENKAMKGASVVINLEKHIELKRKKGDTDKEICEYLKLLDNTDEIHRVVRLFSNAVKMISERLNSQNGFTSDDRKSSYLTLINFTDFAALRLIILACQFMDYKFLSTLKSNHELTSVLADVGLDWDLY